MGRYAKELLGYELHESTIDEIYNRLLELQLIHACTLFQPEF